MRKQCMALFLLLISISYSFVFSQKAEAIPAFARKYNVSCMQCHITIFRRNEFGDAFRRNGYQWPAGKNDDKVAVEKPLPLKGNALGLGVIPKTLPIAFYAHQRLTYDTKGAASNTKDKLQFDPHELEMLMGGTLGKDVSFFGEWLVWEKGKTDDQRLGELWLMLDNLIGRGLNIKIGRMTQSLSLYKENDRLTLNHIIINDFKVDGFKLSGKRHGIEANGILFHRLDYAFGIGDNNNNWSDENYKDFYYHVGWRPSVMTFTGYDPDMDLDNPSIFDFLTLTFNHFGYFGTEHNDADTEQFADASDGNKIKSRSVSGKGEYKNKIQRFGFDLEMSYKRVTWQNGGVLGYDDNPKRKGTDVRSYAFFSEIDIRLKSWLLLIYRFEHADNDMAGGSLTNNHNPALIYLYRENIRMSLEALYTDETVEGALYKFNILYAF